MFDVFEKEKVAVIGMFAFLLLSILVRLILAYIYQDMIREAENMSTTNHKMLKQCKLKFSNCCKLNSGVLNTPIFVEKFLNRLALGRLPLDTVYHLSWQFMLLSVVFSGIGVCRQIAKGSMVGEILPFYLFCLIGIYLYFMVSSMVDVPGKKNYLKVNLVDYLENHLSSRLRGVDEELAGLERLKKAENRKPEVKRTVELMPIGEQPSKMARLSTAQEAELEALLKEFLSFT